jgi:hypothetical protein
VLAHLSLELGQLRSQLRDHRPEVVVLGLQSSDSGHQLINRERIGWSARLRLVAALGINAR